jgi:hypothetical protein
MALDLEKALDNAFKKSAQDDSEQNKSEIPSNEPPKEEKSPAQKTLEKID